LPCRGLPAPRRTTGRERRWLDPNRGILKRAERIIDRFATRYVFPHLLGVWHPYCWLLPRRFALAVATVTVPLWPDTAAPLRVLLLSDVHTGPFLRPEVLGPILEELMRLQPDIVAVTGDIVEGRLEDLDWFLPVLAARFHQASPFNRARHLVVAAPLPPTLGPSRASIGLTPCSGVGMPGRQFDLT
jgi:hypothetical protein